MTIALGEMNLYKSVNGDGGRRLKSGKIAIGAIGAAIARITDVEYAAGYDRIYKFFYAIDNDADETLVGSYVILDAPTPGDDWAAIYAGTATDDSSDHVSPRIYGVAYLAEDYTAGDLTMVLAVEDVSLAGIFADGDTIFPGSSSINQSTAAGYTTTINGAPVVSGTQVTVTLTAAFANNYTVANSGRLASAIYVGDIACSYDNFALTGSGTYDDTEFPVLLDNLGTVEQLWSFSWLDAENFTCTGNTVGALADGIISSNYAPLNPVTAKPYFTLSSGGHGGTHVAGDTLTMESHGPETGFYLNLVGPADSAKVAGRVIPVLIGGS